MAIGEAVQEHTQPIVGGDVPGIQERRYVNIGQRVVSEGTSSQPVFPVCGAIGRYEGVPMADFHRLLREDYGNLIRIRGMLGKPDVVLSFEPQDYEKVFRTEGPWPVRRGLDTFTYYRTKVRPEIFGESGGLANE